MMTRRLVAARTAIGGAALVVAMTGTGIALAGATPGSGSSSTLLGRATVSENVRINDNGIKFKADAPFDIVSQVVTFQPGGTSGWHGHPGPVFVVVRTGTVTVYDASCTPRQYSAGQGFVEGPEPAVVRNEGTVVSESIATLLVPTGQPARIDAPSACPGIP